MTDPVPSNGTCSVCDTPDGDHLDWCTPQAREQRPSKELPASLPAASYDGDLWVRASDVQLVLGQLAEERRENVRWANAHKILLSENSRLLLELRAAHEQLSRPAHEREMPHCSTCACPPYQPAADVVAVIQAEIGAFPGDSAPPLAERIATALGAADLLWREGEPAPDPPPELSGAIAQARMVMEQWPAEVRAAVCIPEPAAGTRINLPMATWAQALDIIGQCAEIDAMDDHATAWIREADKFVDAHADSLTSSQPPGDG